MKCQNCGAEFEAKENLFGCDESGELCEYGEYEAAVCPICEWVCETYYKDIT